MLVPLLMELCYGLCHPQEAGSLKKNLYSLRSISFSHFERESCTSPPMREVHQTSSLVQMETLLSMLSNRSGFEVGGLFPRLKADTLLEAEFRHTTFGPRLRVPRVLADEM